MEEDYALPESKQAYLTKRLADILARTDLPDDLHSTLTEIKDRLAENSSSHHTRKPDLWDEARIFMRGCPQLYALLTSLPQTCFYIKDRDSRFVLANAACARAVGTNSPEAIIGKTEFDFLPGELAEQRQQEDRTVLETGQPFTNHEEAVFDLDGNSIRTVINKYPVYSEDGEVIGLVGIHQDVTECKQIEDRLRYQASIFDHVADAIIVTDLNFRIRYWNKAAERLYGWQAEEVTGKSVREVVNAQYHHSTEEVEALEVLRTQGRWDGETTHTRRDGTPLSVLASVTTLRDNTGNPTGYAAINRDIAERKRADEALHQREALLRSVAESSDDMICVSDADGRYLYYNGPRRYGLERADVVGKTPFDFFDPITAAHFSDRIKQVATSGQSMVAENCVNWQGETLWFIDSVYPVTDADGSISGVASISHNITERRRMEEALRQSEERYRVISELISDYAFAYRVEPDGTTVDEWVTDAFTRISGFTLEEAIARGGWDSYVYPDDLATSQAMVKKLFSGQTATAEMRIVTKYGDIRWLRIYGRPVFDEERGRVVRVYGAVKDITDTKQALVALQENEERLRTLINASPDLICFKDGEGRWLLANDAKLQLFELEDVDYQGKTGAELAEFSPFHRDTFLIREETDEQAWKAKAIARADVLIPRPDGAKSAYDVIRVPLFYPDGRRKGLVVLGRDITERNRAEIALRKSEQRNRAMLAAIPDFMARLHRDGTYLDYSPSEAIPAVSEDEIIGKTVHDLLPPPLARKTMYYVEMTLQTGEIQIWEDTFPGSVDVEVRIAAINDEEVLFIGRDITDRKRAEQHRLERERSQLLRKFISDTSHDLRTPVTTLMTSLYLLGKLTDKLAQDSIRLNSLIAHLPDVGALVRQIGQTAANIDTRARTLDQSALRLKKFVESMGDIVRLDSDEVYTFSQENLSVLVVELARTLQPSAAAKTIFLHLEPGEHFIPVLVDRSEFNRAVQHLIENAIQFTPKGGTVTLRVYARDSQAIFEVQDSGMGISDEDLPHIFERFYRADTARASDVGGIGLGLAIVKQIIDAHKGTIEVESTPGEGSLFRVRVPRGS